MKITSKTQMKIRAKTLAEFRSVVKNAHMKSTAIVVLCDKKHSVASEQMRIGTYIEAYALCVANGIKMISYQAIHVGQPEKPILLTKEEYDKL